MTCPRAATYPRTAPNASASASSAPRNQRAVAKRWAQCGAQRSPPQLALHTSVDGSPSSGVATVSPSSESDDGRAVGAIMALQTPARPPHLRTPAPRGLAGRVPDLCPGRTRRPTTPDMASPSPQPPHSEAARADVHRATQGEAASDIPEPDAEWLLPERLKEAEDDGAAAGDASGLEINGARAPKRPDFLDLSRAYNGFTQADGDGSALEPDPGGLPDYTADTLCGIGGWHPAWLQKLASKKAYVILHGLIGLHQFAMGSYFVATISTIEKRFKIPSKTTGLISAAWDIGSLLSLLLMGYLGSHGHKPRFVAWGMMLMVVAYFFRLLPHLIYGPGQDALELTVEYATGAVRIGNLTGGPGGGTNSGLCGSAVGTDEDDCSDGGSLGAPSIILFMSSIIVGIGSSVYWTLGVAFLDDNSHKDKAPLTLAASSCIRMIGPTIGFSLASYALSQYIDQGVTPLIDQEDPRWIGAWWFGWTPGIVSGVLFGLLMMLFPRHLPRAAERRARRLQHSPAPPPRQKSIKDFLTALRRILKRKVLVFNTLSGVCFMFGYIGYWTFMPKYMETQYRQSASRASLISGSVGLIFTGFGIAASALVIAKFKPRARILAAWSVAVEIIDVIGHFSWAFLNCGDQDLHGAPGLDGSWNLTAACNLGCGCGPEVKYAPVCSPEAATTFYSPCHAGCGAAQSFVNGTTFYSDCLCAPDGLVVEGPCPRDCAFNFGLFIASQCVMRFLGSSGKAGNTLIQFRSVEEDDKPLAIAIGEFLLCGLAFVPGPVVYGALLDSACLVWGQMCGQTGNCWLYDDRKLRYLLNFTAAGCLFCGMSLDIAVWYYAKDLEIYEVGLDQRKKSKDGTADESETPFLENTEKT